MDFVIILDVCEGSPNGDPARDNTPRTDPYDGHGLITDVCVKRKIRDYLTDEGAEMLITREPVAINDLLAQTAKTVDPPSSAGAAAKKGKLELDLQGPRAAAVCKRFMDVRLFGAMAETGDYKAGRIRGPLQLSMGRSLHPVRISRHQVTRIAVTKPEDLIKNNTMSDGNGRQIIRYAAYRMLGTYSPRMGAKTGVSADDLEKFFTALQRCWARDRASARGIMGCRGIWIAIHESEDGMCHASDTHNAVRVTMPVPAEVVPRHAGLERANPNHECSPKAPAGAVRDGW